MRLRQIRQKAFSKTREKSMPAPVGGWNARDALSDMKPDQAVILDNYFPDATEVRLRRGEVAHLTGLSGNVDSLMVYSPLSGTQVLFAANGGNIYNATTAGDVGAAVVSSLTNNQFQYVNFGTSGGQFMLCVNGADAAKTYDGSSWADAGFTGPTMNKLVWCNAHQRRLWVGETGSLSAWYGGVNAISGAFTEFPLYGVATLGGYIMGMATWSRDGGDGSDDVAMFVTSEGEAILYSGTDPSDATTWSLIGVYRIGKPIGRRFFTKAGADVVLITSDGFVSGSAILQLDRSQAAKAAISDQINKSVNEAVRTSKANYGWQAVLYPLGTMLIFNIPITTSTSHQYVFNTNTKAPCRFKGWNARCFAVCNDVLYYGGTDGSVHKADYGSSDSSSYINGDIFPAFNSFGTSLNKKFDLCQCVWGGEYEITPATYLTLDYQVKTYEYSPTSVLFGDAPLWGTALWNVARWAGGDKVFKKWRSVNGIGHAASLRILTSTNNVRPSLRSINYVYQIGGFLG